MVWPKCPKSELSVLPQKAFKVSVRVSGSAAAGTHKDEMTVLYKTKSLDGTKPNTNPKTNPNPNRKLTRILTLFSCFMLF